MSQLNTRSQLNTGQGNTKPALTRSRRWCLTINNFTNAEETHISSFFDEWIYGIECGEQGTRHLQIYGEKVNACKFVTVKNAFERAHIEKAKGNRDSNIRYCAKEGYYKTNFKGLKLPRLPKILRRDELYDWQIDIENLIQTEPDDRTIYWYWDKKGCKGKTQLCKRLCYVYDDVAFSTCVKSADILTGATEYYKTYILNFTRCAKDFDPWAALEQLKDGLVSDCKLKKEGRNLMFAPPHVIVFANKPPNKKKLSEDRWKVTRLDEESDDEDFDTD